MTIHERKGLTVANRFERLPARVIVAVAAIPLIALAIFEGGWFFFAFVALISSISLFEFYRMTEPKGAFPQIWLGMIAGLAVNTAFVYERLRIQVFQWFAEGGIHLKMFSHSQFFLVVLITLVLVVLMVELFRKKGSAILNICATVTGVLVISLSFGLLIGLRELFSFGFPVQKFISGSLFGGDEELATIHAWGGWTVLSLFVAVWICDTAAYFVGSTMGKHKLFERVSPGKTWEGSVAGFLGAVAVMVGAREGWLDYLTLTDAVIIGVLVGVFGQVGDLIESRFKRDAGIKDSSAIIPGHGGVYDRFDSLVFIAPFVYLYIDFVVLS